jgi:hypothetical protein
MGDIKVKIYQDIITVKMGSNIEDSIPIELTPSEENSFIVSGPTAPFAWLVKTLAQIKVILGLGSAAYTASTDYAAASHDHVVADITDFPSTMPPSAHTHNNYVEKVAGSNLVPDTEIAKIHAAGSDAETAQSIMNLGIDEIELSIINGYRI